MTISRTALVLFFAPIVLGSACADPEPTVEGIVVSFDAKSNAEGQCTPERTVTAFIGDTELYAVRGEAVYRMPGGNTEIPFQAVFRSTNDKGISKDDATTLLNHPGPCASLDIEISIDYCEYLGQAREERACPSIQVEGADAFSSITLKRDDG